MTASRRPPPAEEQTSTLSTVAPGTWASAALTALSNPTRTSRSGARVVRWVAVATSSARSRSMIATLVKVEPTSAQTATLTLRLTSCGRDDHGPGRGDGDDRRVEHLGGRLRPVRPAAADHPALEFDGATA